MKRIRRFHFNLMLISGLLMFFGTTGVQAQGKFVDNEVLAGRIANSVHQKIDRRYNTPVSYTHLTLPTSDLV